MMQHTQTTSNKKAEAAGRMLIRGTVLLLLLNVCYLAIMTAVFALPVAGRVHGNVSESMHIWRGGRESEGPIFGDNRIFWNDTSSEMLMVNCLVTEEGPALLRGVALYWRQAPDQGGNAPEQQYANLEAALNNPKGEGVTLESYERYWYLLEAALRLLFCFLTLGEVRWVLYMSGALVSLWLFLRVHRLCGLRGVLPLAAAFLSRLLMLQMASIITAMDVFVALCFMIALTYLYRKPWFARNRILFYLALGSITFAIAGLIAPVLTLGMTLILEVLLTKPSDKQMLSWTNLFCGSVAWALGYGLTLFAKMLVSFAVVRQAEAFGVATGYMGAGNGGGAAARFGMVIHCLERLLMPVQATAMFALLFAALLLFFAIRKGLQAPKSLLQLFAVSLYPVLWVLVVTNHSNHDYAVNIFAVTVYGVAAMLTSPIKEGV